MAWPRVRPAPAIATTVPALAMLTAFPACHRESVTPSLSRAGPMTTYAKRPAL
jgi:hypothetical protein